MFFAFVNHLEWFVFNLCFLEFNPAALSVFRGVGPSEEWQASRGYGVEDKELSLVGSQRNVAFATDAFLPVFGVYGDAAVTCREGLIDPTQGGIFWSPDKAMERRQSLLSEQSIKQATYNKIKKTTSSYANTRNDLLKKRNELQARKEASSSLQDKESINAAIKDIEAELGNM